MTDYSNNPNDPASAAYARIEADLDAQEAEQLKDARDAGLAINAALYELRRLPLDPITLMIIAENVTDNLGIQTSAARHWSPIWTQAEADHQKSVEALS